MSESEGNNITIKKWEYQNFLSYIKERKPQRALIYAKALGIDRRTLVKWMQQPELREAMTEAVDEILKEMQRSGKEDWRMWNKMLELNGITTTQEVDITSDGERMGASLTNEQIDQLIRARAKRSDT